MKAQIRVSNDIYPSYKISISDRLGGRKVEQLWRAAPDASQYNHPSWWEAAYRSFGRGRRLIATSVHHEGQLAAYWPWWVKNLRMKDGWASVLEPVGARFTDYVTPLIRASHEPEVIWEIILDELKRAMGSRTILLCPNAIRNKDVEAVIKRCFPAGLYLSSKHERPCPMLELEADYKEIESRWTKSHRKSIRYNTNRMVKQGNIELYLTSTRDEIVEATRRFIEMHRINWAARGQVSEFDKSADSLTFIEYVTRNMPENLLKISELRLNGQPISSIMCFLVQNHLLVYKTTFSNDMAKYSPTFVHHAQLIRWCCEQGISRYDLMQGAEPYKLRWTNAETITDSYAISRRMAYPVWFWNTKIRDLVIRYRA